jgi:hypothetical protein
MILGLLTGEWLKSSRSKIQKLQGVAIAGVGLLLLGLALQWAGVCPIVKRVWTSSYTLYSGGWVVLILAGFYALIDWKGWRDWAFPLVVVGMNSIAIYVMAWTMKGFIGDALDRHFGGVFGVAGATFQPVLHGLAVLVVFWCILFERIPLGERVAQILGVPEVDSAVDCVGFEAKDQAEQAGTEQPATVLNSLMALTRAGGAIGIPGLYVTDDPGAKESNAQKGVLGLRIGLGWAKSHSFGTGQCPVLRYNRQLMMAILHDKVNVAKAVNVTVLPLEDAPRGYHDFDKGAAKKFVLDPHGMVRSRQAGAELATAGI